MEKFKGLFIYLVLILIFSVTTKNTLYSEEETTESKEELLQKIENLNKILNEKFFIVQQTEQLSGNDLKKHYIEDVAYLREVNVKLFYSLGKVYGYAVFISNNNDFAVIDNTNLKVTFYNKKYVSGKKTFYFSINKDNFQKLTLSRGDVVIAYSIDNINYGNELEEGTIIPVDVECFQLKTQTKIYVY